MKLTELIQTKEYKIKKIQIRVDKRKRQNNIASETDPHISNVDTEYGMTSNNRRTTSPN